MRIENLHSEIKSYLDSSPLNRVEELAIDRIFTYPLVAIAGAGDPLFKKMKDPSVIGEHFLLPEEWLPGAETVISYFIPFSEQIRKANRKGGLPAKEWVYGRYEGEQFNESLRKFIVDYINDTGEGKALAPMLDNRFQIVDRLSSNWSERHAAYIAGLGTFSLSRSLISSKGCAGRYGNIITTIPFPVTARAYSDLYEHCNFCGECIKRCPARAISMSVPDRGAGMEKEVCANYSRDVLFPRFNPRPGCGKCQTAVPCEERIPDII